VPAEATSLECLGFDGIYSFEGPHETARVLGGEQQRKEAIASSLLPLVSCPTLVMHLEHTRIPPAERWPQERRRAHRPLLRREQRRHRPENLGLAAPLECDRDLGLPYPATSALQSTSDGHHW
jgi:hypothetical protein